MPRHIGSGGFLMIRVVALILVLLLAPTVEAAEWVYHGVAHGDAAHEGGGEPIGDEHGCTALQHACGCHVGAPTIVSATTATARYVPPATSAVAVVATSRSRLAEPPLLRPPIHA